MARKRQRDRRSTLDDPMIPLLRRARQQLEAEPGGPLGWLVDFVREDPDTWLPGDVEAHGYRLLALVYGPVTLLPNLVRFREDIPPITPTSVVETHAELRDFFRELVSVPVGQPIRIPTEDLEETMIRMMAPGEKPASWGISRGGPRRTLLYQVVKELVFGQDILFYKF